MERLPFGDAHRGPSHAQVAAMLEQQMSIALDDPGRALELLDAATFDEHEPGVDPAQLTEWIQAQRAWLIDRAETGTPIDAAAAAFSTAIDELKRAVEAAARQSERRSSAAALDAAERCAKLVEKAERKLSKKIAKGMRQMREEAIRTRTQALEDAERTLERAGAHAARVLLDAQERQRQADEAVATAHALQAQLLTSIEAAHANISAAPSNAA